MIAGVTVDEDASVDVSLRYHQYECVARGAFPSTIDISTPTKQWG